MHSHKDYMVCCVMDYAGDVKALSDIISSDCDVSIQGYMSEEFMKVIDSIPSTDNGVALIKELTPYLENGAKVIHKISCIYVIKTHTTSTYTYYSIYSVFSVCMVSTVFYLSFISL